MSLYLKNSGRERHEVTPGYPYLYLVGQSTLLEVYARQFPHQFKEDAREGLEQTVEDSVAFHALRVEFSVVDKVRFDSSLLHEQGWNCISRIL